MDGYPEEIPIPIIDPSRCDGCNLCVQACPTHALALEQCLATVIHPEACDYIGCCELICPKQAISRPFQIILSHRKEA